MVVMKISLLMLHLVLNGVQSTPDAGEEEAVDPASNSSTDVMSVVPGDIQAVVTNESHESTPESASSGITVNSQVTSSPALSTSLTTRDGSVITPFPATPIDLEEREQGIRCPAFCLYPEGTLTWSIFPM